MSQSKMENIRQEAVPDVIRRVHNGCVTLEIMPTLACPVGCPGCDRGEDLPELSDFNDIRLLHQSIVKDFASVKFRISGGEPTLYRNINELIECLLSLEPDRHIEFVTNLLGIAKVNMSFVKNLMFMISVYPSTKPTIEQNPAIRLFWDTVIKKPIEVTIHEHEDLAQYGTCKRTDFDPCACFSPTLMGGSKKVYPCCRAHRFEQMYDMKLHCELGEESLLEKLMAIITDTAMCMKCPRMYTDYVRIPTK